ncbi:hypothetical protein [Nonomuraea aridisoli]|nr:hypothetical protein [Nonomuraea aridisoli]
MEVVDEELDSHVEVCAYLAGLSAAGRAFDTGGSATSSRCS